VGTNPAASREHQVKSRRLRTHALRHLQNILLDRENPAQNRCFAWAAMQASWPAWKHHHVVPICENGYS
jgi:hypothetical protein